jgi:DNA polymerase-3 subunit epsilon
VPSRLRHLHHHPRAEPSVILVLDVETSGLIVRDKPLDAPEQPRIVQLAFVVQDKDRRTLHTYSTLMRPPDSNGWAITKEAQQVHGISTETCSRYGTHPRMALLNVAAMLETVRVLVCFNAGFDLGLIKREVDLLEEPHREQIMLRLTRPRLRRVDVMKVATTLTSDGRWPTLARTHRMLTGEDMAGNHDALEDAKATARCFWALHERRLLEL